VDGYTAEYGCMDGYMQWSNGWSTVLSVMLCTYAMHVLPATTTTGSMYTTLHVYYYHHILPSLPSLPAGADGWMYGCMDGCTYPNT